MEVGVRELKQKASELIRLVREDGQVVTITYHGKSVAMLVPIGPHPLEAESETAWLTLEQLSHEISNAWSENVTVIDAISETR